jgi:hypothetical protein
MFGLKIKEPEMEEKCERLFEAIEDVVNHPNMSWKEKRAAVVEAAEGAGSSFGEFLSWFGGSDPTDEPASNEE